MTALIRRGKRFGFIDVIDTEDMQWLIFDEMSEVALRHHQYRNCFYNGFNNRILSNM